MSKFKVGDRVRCIKPQGSGTFSGGEICLVTDVYSHPPVPYLVEQDMEDVSQMINLDGGGSYFANRFELVSREVDTKATNPKDGAATSRLDLSLVPQTAIVYAALAFTEGALKYGAYNWRDAGVLASVYIAALMRHLTKWYNGEECDPATNVPHLASALACLAVLVDAAEAGKLNDDRPPHVDLSNLLVDFESRVKALQEKYPDGPKRHTEAGK